jgi:hypothetical protein
MRASKRITIAAAAWMLAAAPASASGDGTLSLDYEAYFGGFHVVSARTTISRAGAEYEVQGEARARGLLDWYAGWKGRAVSEGVLGDGLTVSPEVHRNEGEWRGSTRRNSLTFLPDGSVDVEQESPPDPNKLTPIPEESIPGTVDPISAIMALARTMEVAGDCTGTIPVYDGRRRYDLSVTQGDSRVFEPNDYTIFSGEAVACVVDFERIGGFRVEQSKYQQTARDRIVWVGRPLDGVPPIPVRIEVETDYGTLLVHLTAARVGDTEIAVAPGVDNLAD